MIRYLHMWRYDIFTCEEMISSHVKISMISLLPRLSLKLYLNSLVYHRNIFGSSLEVFGNLRKSLEIFRKCSETFVWPSEKLWKIFGNLQKIITDFYIHVIKRTLHISSKIWILCSRGKNNISLVHYAHSWDFVLATRT